MNLGIPLYRCVRLVPAGVFRVGLLVLWCVTPPPARAADVTTDSIQLVWEELAALRWVDAQAAHRAVPAAQRTSRASRLAGAALAAHSPGATAGDYQRALTELDALIAADRADEVGRAAMYFSARLLQWHPYAPDAAEARARFGRLADDAPESFYGQLAALKWAVLLLNPVPRRPLTPMELAEVERRLPSLRIPAVARNYRTVLAEAWAHRGDSGRAYAHYVAALAGGFARAEREAVVLLRAAALADQLGRTDAANEHYRQFLERHPRDVRTFTVREMLQQRLSRSADDSR